MSHLIVPNVFVNKSCGRFCSKGMILLNITPNYPCTQHTHNHILNEHNLSNQYISIDSVKIVYIVYNSESTKFKSYNGYNCKIATFIYMFWNSNNFRLVSFLCPDFYCLLKILIFFPYLHVVNVFKIVQMFNYVYLPSNWGPFKDEKLSVTP